MWEDWGKFIVAKAFKKLPKVQNIAQSGHTESNPVKLKTYFPVILPSKVNGL